MQRIARAAAIGSCHPQVEPNKSAWPRRRVAVHARLGHPRRARYAQPGERNNIWVMCSFSRAAFSGWVKETRNPFWDFHLVKAPGKNMFSSDEFLLRPTRKNANINFNKWRGRLPILILTQTQMVRSQMGLDRDSA